MENCDEYTLSLYIDKMLNVEQMRLVAAHLEECESCRGQYEVLCGIIDDLKNFEELDLPPEFHRQTLTMIRNLPGERIDLVSERRGKRIRQKKVVKNLWNAIPTAAAGLLITLLILSGLGSLLSPSDNIPLGDVSTGAGSVEAELTQDMAVEREAAAFEGENNVARFQISGNERLIIDGSGATASDSSQVIKNYGITLIVDDLNIAVNLVSELPGYNTNASIYNYNPYENGNANMTRVVSADDYEYVKEVLRGIGNIMDEWESAQRIFVDVADTQARTRAKETEIDRLYELLKRSETADDMILIERRLESASSELDSLRSQYMQYMRNISSPTLNINLVYRTQSPQYTASIGFNERLRSSFITSLNMTFGFIETVAVSISSIGFQLFVLCVAIFMAYIVRSVLKRRRSHEND